MILVIMYAYMDYREEAVRTRAVQKENKLQATDLS